MKYCHSFKPKHTRITQNRLPSSPDWLYAIILTSCSSQRWKRQPHDRANTDFRGQYSREWIVRPSLVASSD
ncbi:hypothetical protein Ancab_039422 [Ancistrocladus abbreviatus]